MTDVFCSIASRDAHEELPGTATAETDVWIALEYRRPWAPKPLPGSKLPDPVRGHLAAWLGDHPRARFQMIRRPQPAADVPRRLLLAASREHAPFLLELELARYEDLLTLDLDALLRDAGGPGATRRTTPLHLVCTHGLRDRCCAKWGTAFFQAMAAEAPDDVWQTTHVGGHRFAANCVSLPHGVCYGRLGPADAGPLLAAHRAGDLYAVDHLRGRTCWDAPTQAAEVFLRRATGARALDLYTHRSTETDGDRSVVVFTEGDTGPAHRITVESEPTGILRPKSCGEEPTEPRRFVLESIA